MNLLTHKRCCLAAMTELPDPTPRVLSKLGNNLMSAVCSVVRFVWNKSLLSAFAEGLCIVQLSLVKAITSCSKRSQKNCKEPPPKATLLTFDKQCDVRQAS